MIEQITMFTDPLEERALEILKRAVEVGLDREFESHHGGMLTDINYYFNPRDNCFYYSDRIFNSYKPEPWVKKKTKAGIKALFMVD